MTREFCTLFDSNYAFKAIAMHGSLVEHCPDFHLTAFCFDDKAKRLIDKLKLPRMSTVGLAELEAFDAELLSVKHDRSPVEYCWTATPALPLYIFANRPGVQEVTYLDADLLFFADPEPLFAEMGDSSVLITPHRFADEYKQHEASGIYNVQFLVFRRDERGMEALNWWHDRCIEWCYYRLEDGKLGNQKYLDDWPERFEGVHVLEHKGGGLAPWNITGYHVRREDGTVMVDDEQLVFFHYHRVRLAESGRHAWQPPGYVISETNRELVYDPYLRTVDRAVAAVKRVDESFKAGLEPPLPTRERLRRARIALAQRVVTRVPALGRLSARLRAG